MVQLINSQHKRDIKSQTLRDIFDNVSFSPKLRKWAIDQFHAKIAYGYTGYDNQKDDDLSNEDNWKTYAKDIKAFSYNLLEACFDAAPVVNRVKKP